MNVWASQPQTAHYSHLSERSLLRPPRPLATARALPGLTAEVPRRSTCRRRDRKRLRDERGRRQSACFLRRSFQSRPLTCIFSSAVPGAPPGNDRLDRQLLEEGRARPRALHAAKN